MSLHGLSSEHGRELETERQGEKEGDRERERERERQRKRAGSLVSLRIKTPILLDQIPSLTISLTLDYLLMGSISKYSHIGGLVLPQMNLAGWGGGGGHYSVHSRCWQGT